MHSKTTNDPSRVADLIAAIGSGVVLLDGCTGAGKTTLGQFVCRRLGTSTVTLVEADQYLRRKQGRYVGALRMDKLKQALDAASAQSRLVLLAGVCARQIAEGLRVTAALSVYVLRATSTGLAGDLDILDAEEGLVSDLELSPLDAEIRAYHASHKPRHNADIIYVRTE